MTKVQIKYETNLEIVNVIKALSNKFKIKNISKPYKTGKYYRVYVDLK